MQRLVPKRVVKIEGESFLFANTERVPCLGFTNPSWVQQLHNQQTAKRDWVIKKSWFETLICIFLDPDSADKVSYGLELRSELLRLCFPTVSHFKNASVEMLENLATTSPASFMEELTEEQKQLFNIIISFTVPSDTFKTIPPILQPYIDKEIKKQIAREVFAINLCRLIVGENSPKGKILVRDANGRRSFRVLSQRIDNKDLHFTMVDCVNAFPNDLDYYNRFKNCSADPEGRDFAIIAKGINDISHSDAGLFRSQLIRLILGDKLGCVRFENFIINNGEVVNIDTGNFLSSASTLQVKHLTPIELLDFFRGGAYNPSSHSDTRETFNNGCAGFAYYFSNHEKGKAEIRHTLVRLHEVLASDLTFLYDKFRTLPDGSELLSHNDIRELSSFLNSALEQVKALLPSNGLDTSPNNRFHA